MSLSLPTKIPNHHPNSIYQSGININSRRHILVSSSLFPSMKAPISSSSTELHMSSTSKIQEESECDSELTEEEIKLQRARVKEERKAKKQKARDKRREFIGMAKAVDRGQWPNIYNPGGSDGVSFEAKSGLPDRTKPFLVLGIESSCDDTGAAVVRSDGVILGESLASQHDIHENFGGIVPNLARNAHIEKIDSTVQEAIANAGLSSVNDVDAIGVTVGPGLEICLRVGCHNARELAIQYDKPFVGIHHLEAHILMARLGLNLNDEKKGSFIVPATEQTHEIKVAMEFPFLALLVSGGHCQIMKCIGIGQYSIIGGTIDDSLGEAFDKTARLLGLPVGGGGGPAVEKLARLGDPKSIPLPVPMQKRKDCDFSYAGLKTSVRTNVDKLLKERALANGHDVDTIDTSENRFEELTEEDKANIAASFQNVAIRHIEDRLNRAMTQIEEEENNISLTEKKQIRTLAVVGGVAANTELRTRLQALCDKRNDPWSMHVPPPRLCTDQGSMAAWAAIERLMVGSSDEPKGHDVYARYPFSDVSN